MKTLNRASAVFTLLLGVMLMGCTASENETSYRQAVESVETMLGAKVDKGIFPFTKEAGEGQTTFRFIEGSRMEKVDHATPLKVVVTIREVDDGQGSAIEVEAHQHGLKLKKRDKDAEERWRQELSKLIEKG